MLQVEVLLFRAWLLWFMVQGLGYISGLVTIRDGLEMFWVVQSLGSVGILGSESRAWVMFSSDLFNRLKNAGNIPSWFPPVVAVLRHR